MAVGQRRRQRLKRQRSRQRLGDATPKASPDDTGRGWGNLSAMAERWSNPSRGDLWRLAVAVREGRLDSAPPEVKAIFVEAACNGVKSKSVRLIFRGARAILAMDARDIDNILAAEAAIERLERGEMKANPP